MNELEVLINLRGRIRRRNGLSKDGSEERTLTLNQLDALDFALNRIEKLDRLEKWLKFEEKFNAEVYIRELRDVMEGAVRNDKAKGFH